MTTDQLKGQAWSMVLLVLAFSFLAIVLTSLPAVAQQRKDLSLAELSKVQEAIKPTKDFSKAEKSELLQAGAGTLMADFGRDSFSKPLKNLSFEQRERFFLGNALFRKLWVSAPSSTKVSDGLGPIFTARACQSCHIKDGRGNLPLLRLARPAGKPLRTVAGAPTLFDMLPDPVYGRQLQELSVPGMTAEGRMKIDYENLGVELASGGKVWLRKPSYSIVEKSFGNLHPKTSISPRVASPMIGLGLIEQIHEMDILQWEDPSDKDQDGISGRAVRTFDLPSGQRRIGRFGWKAQNASIEQQSAEALAFDIGISSPLVRKSYGDCTEHQEICKEFPTGEDPKTKVEASTEMLKLLTFYAQNLAVPARRDVDQPDVLAGKKLFYEAGCISCHRPKFVTHKKAKNSAHAYQLIWPYSDFLVHDMGEGLADGQIVGQAGAREWRTAPLWGIGLTEKVSGHTQYLHDGRALNLTEAILWHGGEATKSRDQFTKMSKDDRAKLLRFLESL